MAKKTINSDLSSKNKDKKEKKKKEKEKKEEYDKTFILAKIKNSIWVSVSEAARLGGVNSRTIRRAIQEKKIVYKIVKDRYQIEIDSVFYYLHSNKKLRNKLYENGIGQYIEKWQK